MKQHIRIRMALQTHEVIDFNPADDELRPGHQFMNIGPCTHPYLHLKLNLLCTKLAH
jgi:hypothetical protein